MAEVISKVVIDVIKANSYTYVLAQSSNKGKNFLPRVAAHFDSQLATDVLEIIDKDTFKRPLYAGNAIATIRMKDNIKVKLSLNPPPFYTSNNSLFRYTLLMLVLINSDDSF